jgi:excisionase family DNA binding protein
MPTDLDLVPSFEAAQLLGIDRSVLSRMVSKGKIEAAFKSPGRTGIRLFRRADVEALAEQRKAKQ